MKKKIAKVSAASLITLSMTVGNVAAFNNHDDLSVEDESSNDKNIDLNSNSTTELENNSSIETKNGNKEVIGQTKFVDENGNITTVDVYDGTTGEVYNPRLRVVSTANMVNFNCSSAGTTTEFVDYYTGQAGYISKASAADAAFLGYENGKVKFMISGVTGLVDPSKVEVLTQGTYYASNYEVNSSGNLYHYISNNVNATGNQGNSNYVGKGPSYLTKGKEYYSYDGHYFYENYNTMITDYKNNVRTNSVNPSTPYYNYFQYLPMRSKTNYTAQELTTYLNNKANSSTSKLNNTGDMFIKYQNKYGVNALMAASFAALESGWGKSSIAQNKNNLFGMNATDANPSEDAKKYSSVEACIEDFASNWMSKKYLNGTYTSLFRGGYFGDKGSGIFGKYSSDPYEGEKCASIAENMDASISGKDKNYYTIGVKDVAGTSRTNLNVRQSSNISSTVLYTTIKNPSYAFIVRKKTPENEFYEIQSDSVLNSNRTAVSTSAEYNYDSDYAYVSSNHLTIVNNGNDISYEKNEAPVISNAKITNVSRSGYTVTCTVTDDNAVDRVLMPTWSENNGQDDLIWYTANRTGNTYTIEVKTSNHKNDSGKYHTDIYAYDSEGKVSKVELTATVPGANEAPVISNAKITNVSRSGYTVTCTVTDDNAVDRVLMPTWSENNGQDDLIWYTANRTGNTYTIEVDMMNHNYDTGKINTDIYAYDDEGEYSKLELDTKIEENQAPVISDVKVINVTSDEYTVICKVTDDLEVVRVQMPTWTVNNGQDDIVWHEAELKNGVATFTVNRKDHNFEYGDYITHIYAYDREGLKGFSICGTVNLKEPDINTSTKPIIKNVKISNINDSGYTVTCTVLSNNKITEVLFPTWTYKNEQDDLIWGVGQKLENEYTFRVNRSDHNYEFGTYVTHIYAYDEKGAVNNIELPFHNIINTTERIGWAYIDGQKYFFDNKGNIAGNMPSKKVIDVSSYNGNIDWNTVKQYGDVDGAILRIAAHPNGEYIEDVQFANNLAACRRLKIPFGVYIYDYSNSENDALNEAKFVIDILQKYNVTPDELGYPVYFDLERTTITKEQNIANMNAFISEMNAKGYTTNVYSYRAMLNSSLNDKAILSNVSWMAAYTDTIGWENPYYKGKFGWQYTSSGSIPGISGNVDISCWYTI
ncbi:GBS Bsp-like repeat-containing protein [Erysipelatoclostridium ramosum]|uniref:GBS Bsp-like repeat-containing protein n=1 Tax=Thomasclavelia TaxID=3025755 RepID=UPI001C393227|nr:MULTISPECIES: GBS Bsp-like repeat-containing protein [Thomasclavelia]MBV3159989.1 GBS Bsp-like repeat-containing protein [Thomasclavelia ramosa]MBV3167196.1 GBS Bsp-like repeat-containing protein [Erysipelatoclostridium sp. MSK.23.68]MCB5438573.1 GBS Bsp-like repeat-containing protein [Thomasclavelia ramosa]